MYIVVTSVGIAACTCEAARIELATNAKVNGDVYYNLIEMAMGAAVNGSLVHRQEAETSVVNFAHELPDSATGQE